MLFKDLNLQFRTDYLAYLHEFVEKIGAMDSDPDFSIKLASFEKMLRENINNDEVVILSAPGNINDRTLTGFMFFRYNKGVIILPPFVTDISFSCIKKVPVFVPIWMLNYDTTGLTEEQKIAVNKWLTEISSFEYIFDFSILDFENKDYVNEKFNSIAHFLYFIFEEE